MFFPRTFGTMRIESAVAHQVDGDKLERQYRDHLSGYHDWEQLPHASDWILFEKNIGAYVGLDEVCLSRGELYTVLINKERKGGKGSIIAILALKMYAGCFCNSHVGVASR